MLWGAFALFAPPLVISTLPFSVTSYLVIEDNDNMASKTSFFVAACHSAWM